MESLVVLAQDSNDAPTLLWNPVKGALMVLKYECTFQRFWLRRVPINHARVMSVGDFQQFAQACSGLWCDQASEERSLPYKSICCGQSRCRNRVGESGL
ncbi:hypothetical protein D3C81_1569030 [compost metagenome]